MKLHKSGQQSIKLLKKGKQNHPKHSTWSRFENTDFPQNNVRAKKLSSPQAGSPARPGWLASCNTELKSTSAS